MYILPGEGRVHKDVDLVLHLDPRGVDAVIVSLLRPRLLRLPATLKLLPACMSSDDALYK
jgi:hypothetical protein